MISQLLVTNGSKQGTCIQFKENEPFWVGRDASLDFVLSEEAEVSTRHGYFLYNEGSLNFVDESINGTLLNGYKIKQTKVLLQNTDILCIGQVHFQVMELDVASSQENLGSFDACIQAIEKRKNSVDSPAILEKIDDYLIIGVVGEGSSAIVYKAIHQESKQIVALKVFSSLSELDNLFKSRFLREVELLRKLVHPLIITLYNAGAVEIEEEHFYLVLDYFPGVNLSHFIKNENLKSKGMSWQKVLKILYQVTKALIYMHEQGILHRDLKPGNLMYNPITETVKLIDFGLGKCLLNLEQRTTIFSTKPNSTLGTPNFMAVEQWQNIKGVDERTDIYSLGASAYFLLTGELPFGYHQNLTSMYLAVLEQKLKPLADCVFEEVPKAFLKIVETMMAFQAKSRYPSGKKLLLALKKVAHKFQIEL